MRILPEKSSDGLSAFHGCIYGESDNIFGLVAAHDPNGAGMMAKMCFSAWKLAWLYTKIGTYHIMRSIGLWWINPYRFALGCLYITGGLALTPPGIQVLYKLWIFSNSSSDGFIPVWSQIMPDYVVPDAIRSKGLYFKKPAPKDNHETETWGNSQSVEEVVKILKAIAHNSKVTKGVGR